MRYWDASALVPLIVSEPTTDEARAWLYDDPAIVTWAWSSVEIGSAIERKVRDGFVNRRARRDALDRLDELADSWDEVTDISAVRRGARVLLARHQLRAADAGQLAAALLVVGETGTALPFACLDERLVFAADVEGLDVWTIETW
ncbi:MAG: type II toxin-antitoxin system VapC family toxin [Actinomycetota bacterium]|nr:type II toxin-antitoxin system VapC family toxin [Actinomycetota bacterium]